MTLNQNTKKTKSAKTKHVIDLVRGQIPFGIRRFRHLFFCFDGVGQNKKKIYQAPNPRKGLSTVKSTLPACVFTINYKYKQPVSLTLFPSRIDKINLWLYFLLQNCILLQVEYGPYIFTFCWRKNFGSKVN